MKILVVAPNWLGDVIFMTPVFAALKKSFPGCFIGCVLPARCKDVLLNNPDVDELITFNEKKEDRNLFAQLAFVQRLGQKKYNMVILMHRSMTRAFLMFIAGIKVRIGYGYPKRSWLLTKCIPVVDKDSFHKQNYYLGLLRASGINVDDTNCRVYVSPEEQVWADSFLAEYKDKYDRFIALNLVTNWAPKNWPLKNFRGLIDILKEKYNKALFFLTSASWQDEFAVLLDKNDDRVVDLSGKTSLRQLAAIYQQMDLVVSGDSGPLHLAAAVGAKYIGIYGPTDPKLTGVRAASFGRIIYNNQSCVVPCYLEPCPKGLVCMKNVSAQTVAEAAQGLL